MQAIIVAHFSPSFLPSFLLAYHTSTRNLYVHTGKEGENTFQSRVLSAGMTRSSLLTTHEKILLSLIIALRSPPKRAPLSSTVLF